MKNGQIFAHKSTARGRLDLEYLDEISSRKISLRERADMEQQVGRALKVFADYASKETLGQVHAGGFFHHRIRINPDGTSTAPSQLSNDERKHRITETWQNHLAKFPSKAKRPVLAHRLTFSMSKEQHDAFAATGINPDQVLHSTMKKVMRKFAEKFHAGDAIGYAYGLHHDTAHLHAHLALCPRTANGRYVGCSTSRFIETKHKKQMDYVRRCFEKENEHWSQILSSPEKLEESLSKRLDSDRLTFSPKLNHLQMNALRASQTHEATRLQQLYRSVRNLENALAARRAAVAAHRNLRFAGKLLGYRPGKFQRVAAKISAAAQLRSIRELQQQLFKTKRQYRELFKRYAQIHGFSSYANRNANLQQNTIRQQNAL